MAKMHQIHFLLGLRARPRWGSLQCPRPLPLFKGPTSKGMEGNGRGGEKVKGMKGRGGGRDLAHRKILVWRPPNAFHEVFCLRCRERLVVLFKRWAERNASST